MKPSSPVVPAQLSELQQKKVLMVAAQTQTTKTVSFADDVQGSGLVYRGDAQGSARAGSSSKTTPSNILPEDSAARISAFRIFRKKDPKLISQEWKEELDKLQAKPEAQLINRPFTEDEQTVAKIYFLKGRLDAYKNIRDYNRQQSVAKLNAKLRRK